MRMPVEGSILQRYSQGVREREEALSACLEDHPVVYHGGCQALQHREQVRRSGRPLIPGEPVDFVISNCVRNRVAEHEKPRLVIDGDTFRCLTLTGVKPGPAWDCRAPRPSPRGCC